MGRLPIIVITGLPCTLSRVLPSHASTSSGAEQHILPYPFCFSDSPSQNADPDLLKQIFTKSFMKFHDRATPLMANNEGERVFDEGILFAK